MNPGTRRLPAFVCPSCRISLDGNGPSYACLDCGRNYPSVAGLTDLRLTSDRYLDLAAERAKAERLSSMGNEPGTDLARLAAVYYAMTDDVVDHRKDRFLAHIAGAGARGEAMVGHLPDGGLTLEVGCGTGGLLASAARSR
jgi:hypothetical protein